MEARASGGRRKRQDRGSGEKAFTVQAPRGAADWGWRQRSERQAVISYMNEVRIPAFAKINVRLDVLGKRPDGFHELRTIFQSISLHDDLVLRCAWKAMPRFPPSRWRRIWCIARWICCGMSSG